MVPATYPKGFYYLDAATGKEMSPYHLEAAIHWTAIYYLYGILYMQHSSPFIALNKAIAALYAKNELSALSELHAIVSLEHYYASGNKAEALSHYHNALRLTHSTPEL